MTWPVPLIQRAYELARSGAFPNVVLLGRALEKEGYANVTSHLAGKQIRTELRHLGAAARLAAGMSTPPGLSFEERRSA